jgi:hypothetical protein
MITDKTERSESPRPFLSNLFCGIPVVQACANAVFVEVKTSV